ncbi:MAG: DUF2220 family protein [Spirochaetaceae bacterium]|jgi:hypothetical protein|nr:DUF2220 family protein [Spirochaetaceae bacterium]
MIHFEEQIIAGFYNRIMKSKTAADKPIIIPAQKIYPEFTGASKDKKEAFLEAAKKLEKQRILELSWEKHGKSKSLKSLICVDRKKIFKLKGKIFPETTAKKIKKVERSLNMFDESHDCRKLLNFIAKNLTLPEIDHGIDEHTFSDLAVLIKSLYDSSHNGHNSLFLSSPYSLLDGITTRALSIRLYDDPTQIKNIKSMFTRILTRAKKHGMHVPDFSFIDGSFPETWISGGISLHFGKNKKPLINHTGEMIGLSLKTITEIEKISVIHNGIEIIKPTVLTIENKETFYALAPCKKYTCLLYTGGYPNRAVNALLRILSNNGFDFFHAGDVDPDGILILQELKKTIEKPITPIGMDANTFNKYRKHGRKLNHSMLHNIRLINNEIRSIEGIEDLLKLIESTGLGIEQELIDYGYILTKSK